MKYGALTGRHAWASGLGLAVMAAVSLTTIHGTLATNWGSQGSVGVSGTTNGVFLVTNYVWNVTERELTQTYNDGVTLTVNYDYENTELDSSVSVSTTCENWKDDACVFDDNFGNNGFAGWNGCVSGTQSGSHPNMTCGLDHVRINTFFSPTAAVVACHELGHSVGLRHSTESGSCLQTPLVNSTTLTDHDKQHINNYLPF